MLQYLLLICLTFLAFAEPASYNLTRLKYNRCPYRDKKISADEDHSIFGELNKIQASGSICEPVKKKVAETLERLRPLHEKLKADYTDRDVISHRGVKEDCTNFEFFAIKRFNLVREDILMERDIKDKHFSQECAQHVSKDIFTGDLIYSPQIGQCLYDAFSEDLYAKRKDCVERTQVGEMLSSQRIKYLKDRVKLEQTLNEELALAFKDIYSLLSDESCKGMNVEKKNKLLDVGLSLSSSLVMKSLSSFTSDLAANALEKGAKIVMDFANSFDANYEKSENIKFEKMACLAQKVMQEVCDNTMKRNREMFQCKKISMSYPHENPFFKMFDYLGMTLPSEINHNDYSYFVKMNNFLGKASLKNIPVGSDNFTFEEVLQKAQDFYRENSFAHDEGQLQEAMDIATQSKVLLEKFKSLRAETDTDHNQELQELLAKLKQKFIQMNALPTRDLLKNYLQSKQSGEGVFNREMSKEMSSFIFSGAKPWDTGDGYDNALSSNLSILIDELKPKAEDMIKRRYRRNMEAFYNQEKASINTAVDPERVKILRTQNFNRLRDVVLDCSVLQSVFFHNHKKVWWLNWIFFKDQLPADLNISEYDTYLKACSPFMCPEGIPVPSLGTRKWAPERYRKRYCQDLRDSNDTINRIKKDYIEKGTLCGKTAGELTASGKNFNFDNELNIKRSEEIKKQMFQTWSWVGEFEKEAFAPLTNLSPEDLGKKLKFIQRAKNHIREIKDTPEFSQDMRKEHIKNGFNALEQRIRVREREIRSLIH